MSPSSATTNKRLNSLPARAATSLACQTLPRIAAARQAMAFKNEVASDDDIDRYKLPFPKGEGRWWTRDAKRDYYLWGGLVGNLAYEETQEGWFYLYVDGVTYDIYIEPSERTKDTTTGETIIHWHSILDIKPKPEASNTQKVLGILRDALTCFGFDGRENIYFSKFRVSFDF